MKRPSSADASSASSRQKRSKGSLRGLLVGSDHIGRFFDPDPSKRKTCEIRNFNVRCVKPQEEIYLAQSGLKDSYGNGVFCVRGKAIFKGNTFVPHSEVPSHRSKHQCSDAEYEAVKSSWSQDKNGCVLWEFEASALPTPMYLAPRPGEDRVCVCGGFNLCGCAACVVCVQSGVSVLHVGCLRAIVGCCLSWPAFKPFNNSTRRYGCSSI